MVRVLVTGCLGRMGARIISMVRQTDGIELVAAVERAGHQKKGEDIGTQMGFGEIGVPVSDDICDCIDRCDVIIDFTNSAASMENVQAAKEHGKAIVIGSTGFSAGELDEIKTTCSSIRCVLAPNMSVGVNLLFKMLRDIAPLMKDDYDIEIIEAHHRHKKDAQSGTALKLAQVIANAVHRDLSKVGVFSRHGLIGARTDEEIGIQTIRGGDIVGEHTIIFAGIGERIEIAHKATNRDNFAKGAVKAALWICSQENGFYDMMDVLGLNKP